VVLHAWRALLLAGRFLTRWPFPVAPHAPPALYGHAAPFYPVIGLLLGALLAGLGLGAATLGVGAAAGAWVLAALLLVVWVWSTGALHLDGLADCADAWVGGLGSRERTFTILKDPHIGSMGVVALVLVLLVRLAALAVLLGAALDTASSGVVQRGWIWVLLWVPALARAQILWLVLTTPPARSEGLGAALDAHLPRRPAWLAAGFGSAVALSGIAAVSVTGAIVAGGAALLVLVSWRSSLRQHLGGHSGDGIGALVELTETWVLLGLALVAASSA
jgi:adenosylcobinamide-GDP ribazoletransferase